MSGEKNNKRTELQAEIQNLHQQIDNLDQFKIDFLQSQQEREILKRLAMRISTPLNAKSIAQVIADESRGLFDHDSFNFTYYDNVLMKSIGVYCEDTLLGEEKPRECGPIGLTLDMFRSSRAFAGESTLINRAGAQDSLGLIPIGDKKRLSRSLMFTPILWSGETIGIMSVQSYTSNKYSDHDLKLLELVASICSGAVSRALTEERLRLFQHTLESISEMVTITDLENRFIYTNQAFLNRYGYSLEEVIGKNVNMLWSSNNSPGLLEEILRESRNGGWANEILNLDKAGNEFPISLSTSLLKNDQGKIIGLIGVSSDIAERKQNEKRINAYINLGRILSQVRSQKEAARLIVQTADEILGWDACYFMLVSFSDGKMYKEPILAIDIIDGELVECTETLDLSGSGHFIKQVITQGKQLILRSANERVTPISPFGDKGRRAASLMFVPVYRDEKIVAVLSIQSYTYNAYSSDDLDMLQSLADHCGGALDRIQTETELRRSKEKSEIFATLAHRLNSVRTPKEAGYVIAEIADSLLGFDACFIDLYSPEKDLTYHVLNIDTVDNQKVEYLSSSVGQITPLKRRVLTEGRFLILRETQEEQDTQNSVPTIEFGNVSKPSASLMFVPAHKGEKLVGIISLQSYTPQAYTEEDLQTLQDLANHCGGTLERIRIEQAIIQERHRIDIFTELGKKLSASYTPKEAGTIILQAARELIGWDSCFLLLYSENRDYLTPTYSIDLIDGQYVEVEAPHLEGTPSARGYTRKTIQEGKQLILREKTQDVDFPMVPFGDRSHRSASLMFVPINAGEEVIGVLSIQSYAFHAYNRDDLDLLESLAQHCSGALERIRVEEERKNLEEQIQHAQKMESLGVLAGGIAHDFNNLLMSILGNADLVLLDLPEDSMLRDNLLEIEKASRRAADLCNQMLAYSGKGRFIVQAVNVTEIVEEMAHLLKVSISKKIDLQYRFATDLPSTKADVTQLRQIIMNLITNASEAIGDTEGVITMTTGVKDCGRNYLRETYLDDDLIEGSYVYIEVSDTGCGMSEETIQKIFDPFFTTKFTGRGLGLAAVLGIVRGHHGALKVNSTVGQGTTFRVLLPTLNKPAPPQTDLPANTKLWKGDGIVLLVDDEKSILKIGKRMLEQLGFSVLTAMNGHEALEVFRNNQNTINCVLLDLTMPNMDGKETFHELIKIRKDTRIVLCSGYTEEEIEDRFDVAGLAGFIQKPYKLNKLSAKMQEIFQGNR